MGRPARRVSIESHMGLWAWHCIDCGWAGLGCWTRAFARQEADRHVCPPAQDSHVAPEWLKAASRG